MPQANDTEILKQLTVLYVEDEPDIRDALSNFLRLSVKEYCSATNGQEGFDFYRKMAPDLVITDIRMPVMNGLEMTRRIKEIDPSARIIVTTAFTDTEYFLEAIELGVDKFILKPILLAKLKRSMIDIAQLITSRRALDVKNKLLSEYRRAVDEGSAVIKTDTEHVITYVNDEFCRLLAAKPKDIIGRSIDDFWGPEMSDEEIRALYGEIATTETWKGMLQHKREDDIIRMVDATVVPILDVDGEVVEYIWLEHNITTVVDTYRRVLDTVYHADNSLTLIVDSDFRPVFINGRLLEFIGMSNVNEFREKGVCICDYTVEREGFMDVLCDDGSGDPLLRQFFEQMEESKQSTPKIAMKSPVTGEERFFSVNTYTISNTYLNTKNLYVMQLVDITILERVIHEQLENMKLLSIGKLSAGITHEINTPLTYMKGNLEMIESTLESVEDEASRARLKELLEPVVEGIEKISTIIESMREIAGVREQRRVPANVYRTAVMACRMINNRARHTARIAIDGEPFSMDMDKDGRQFLSNISSQQIEQLWIILLNNALDEFSDSTIPFEDRRITIEFGEEDGFVTVSIKDNAGGIDEDVLRRLFESFVSSKDQGGMGLGLNIARSIVSNHGGTITGSNEKGGAVFTVRLPKFDVPAEAEGE